MNLRRILVSVVAAVALIGMSVPAPADTSRIKASGSPGSYKWGSGFKHITKGDKVVWKNPTGAAHTVTAYAGSWSKNSNVPSGGQTSFKFTRKGSFKYRCITQGHSSLSGGECKGMCGEIHVTR